jgi:hypothetical protein
MSDISAKWLNFRYVDESIKILAHQKFHLSCQNQNFAEIADINCISNSFKHPQLMGFLQPFPKFL